MRSSKPNPASRTARRLVTTLLLAATVATLFLGFYRNQWAVVREKRFKEFQLDSESLVIARMVESGQHGVLSHNGLLGWGDADPNDLNQSDYDHQYRVFLADGQFGSFSLYKSASGVQALLFSMLHEASPFAPAVDLRNFRALVALLLALVLGTFVAWIFGEFGWLTAGSLVLTTILSQWITLFGHNLFYFIWASFLPISLVAGYLAWQKSRDARTAVPGLMACIFGSVLFKCLTNGYDFIIPALSMPVIPVVYYAVKERWPRRQVIQSGIIVLAGIGAAVLTSMVVLAAQLQVSEGSFLGGVASILSTFGRRTFAKPDLFPGYAESLQANPWTVLWTYIAEDSAIGVIGFRFLDLIVLAAGITIMYTILKSRRPAWFADNALKSHALIVATWLSLLSPLSWFFIFKGQAYVHTHTNYLAWHMPFALFAYSLCAWLLQQILRGVFMHVRRVGPVPKRAA